MLFFPSTDNQIPDLYSLTREVPLTLQNSHYSVADSVPYLSNVVNVACLHCRPATQLNSDLESFLRRGNFSLTTSLEPLVHCKRYVSAQNKRSEVG